MYKVNSLNITFFQKAHHFPNSFLLDSHVHPHHELYFLESGKTTYFVRDSIYVLEPGDFILIPAGVYHHTTNTDSADIDRVLLNFIDSDLPSDFFDIFFDLIDNPHIKITDRNLPEIKKVLKRIEVEEVNKPANYEKMQHLYFMQLLILISRYREAAETRSLFSPHVTVQDAATYITANYDQDLSLNFLANKYSLTPGYFSKIFKRYTGTNLSDYIRMIRISAAKELLEETDLSIVDISFAVGFNDSNYFSSTFKKLTGISPKKYALQHKNTEKHS